MDESLQKPKETNSTSTHSEMQKVLVGAPGHGERRALPVRASAAREVREDGAKIGWGCAPGAGPSAGRSIPPCISPPAQSPPGAGGCRSSPQQLRQSPQGCSRSCRRLGGLLAKGPPQLAGVPGWGAFAEVTSLLTWLYPLERCKAGCWSSQGWVCAASAVTEPGTNSECTHTPALQNQGGTTKPWCYVL